METRIVAKINEVEIVLIEGGEKRVPIRPICDALGVSYPPQFQKIKDDPILGPAVTLSITVAKDGKDREMQTLPYALIFGWLFSINPKNVKPEARDAVLAYKMECYYALFNHFTSYSVFLEEKQKLMEQQMEEIQEFKLDFSQAKKRLTEAEKKLRDIRDLSYEDWDAARRQMKLEFEEEE